MRALGNWSIKNNVCVNLIMIFIIMAGIFTVIKMRREVFPQFSLDMIAVSVVYPGSSPEEVEEGATFHRRERRFGNFSRSFRLPFKVDAAKVDASFKNGVLSISLPRAEEDKPRKIAIKAG